MTARDRLTGPSNTGVWYFTDAMSAGQAGGFSASDDLLPPSDHFGGDHAATATA